MLPDCRPRSVPSWRCFTGAAANRSLTCRLLLLACLSGVLSGCVTTRSSHPLNIAEEEWPFVSQAWREQAQTKQSELNGALSGKYDAQSRAFHAWGRVGDAEAARDALYLDVRRHEARYGERVLCWIEDAEILRKRWRPLRTATVDIVTEMHVPFELMEKDSGYSVDMFATFDGRSVSVCRSNSSCLVVTGAFSEYRRAMVRRIEVPDYMRGQLRCYFIVD